MNNNLKKEKDIPIVRKPIRKRLLDLEDIENKKAPTISLPIINPFKMWREGLADTKKTAFLQGFIAGITEKRRFTNKRIKNDVSSPTIDPLGDFDENSVEDLKEAFVLGFTQGIIYNER